MPGGQFASFLAKLLFFLFFVTNTNALKPKEATSSILSRLLGTKINKPIVLLVNVGKNPSDADPMIVDPVSGSDDDGGFEGGVLDAPDDQETYLLYNMLRSTPEENLAPEVAVSVSQTKEVLRQALRRRCQKLDSCQKKCRPKRLSCKISCQEVFDNLNACDPPPRNPCNKCGKTLPPSWLL